MVIRVLANSNSYLNIRMLRNGVFRSHDDDALNTKHILRQIKVLSPDRNTVDAFHIDLV